MSDETDDKSDYITSCVSCGGPIQVSNKIRGRHTCPPRHEAALKAAHNRSYDDVPTRRTMTEGQRLSTGFDMLDEEDDGR
jgi:hypothetical protein